MAAKNKTQRENILAAASELLATGGAEALRVRDIAAAAGCSTMGVYSHFGGKEGLVNAIFVDGFERFTEALRSAWAGPATTRIVRIGGAYRDWALQNPGPYSVMFAGAVPGFVPGAEALTVAAKSYEVLTDGVSADQAEGRIGDGDPNHIAWTLWGLVHGLVMLELAGMSPPTRPNGAEDIYQNSLTAIAAGLAPGN